MRILRWPTICLLFLWLTVNAWADPASDAKKRTAEINKAITQSEERIGFYRKTNPIRNAALIEKETAKIEALKNERTALVPTLEAAHLNKLDRLVAKEVQATETQLTEALQSLRALTDGDGKSAANSIEQSNLRKMQKGYLAVLTRRMLGESAKSQHARITEVSGEGREKLGIAEAAVLRVVDATWEEPSDERKIKLRAQAEASYRIARLKIEAATMARITLQRGGEGDATAHMRKLMEDIATNDPNNFVPDRDAYQKETHKWFRQLKREVDLEEYRRTAAHGAMFDERKLITGKTRQEIAYYSELALAQRVKMAASTMPISRLFWPTDTRIDLAEKIRAEAMSNPDHAIFAYLQTGVEPSPRMYMFAVMRALRFEQEKINTWLVEANGQTWYNTGLGTLLRTSDAWGTGDASFTEVKKRINQYTKEVDAVHDSFLRATKTEDPEDLSQDDKDLLSAFGYVGKSLDGTSEYRVPKEGNIRGLTAGAQRGLKLPGAAVLDVVTPKNVAVTVISTVVPGGFATMVEGMALRAGAGTYSIMAVKVMAEMGMGMAIDSTVQYMETGKVDAEAIFLDSILLGGVLEGSNRVTGRAAGEMAKKLAQYKTDSILSKILQSEAVQKRAASWINQSLGIASEAAITALYEEKFKGNDVDFNIFLSNLVNSAMTRYISAKHAEIQDGTFIPDKTFKQHIQDSADWLWAFVKDDPALLRQMYHISSEQFQLQQAAMGRFREAVGEGEPSAHRLFKSLLRGEISWMDLTIAYQRDTSKMESLMYGVKELRDNFFEQVMVDAVRLARKELRAELKVKVSEIDAMDITPAERERLTNEAMDAYLHDARYMAEQIISPGSKSPVSDIDRSMQNPKLRRLMEHMFEVRAREINDGMYLPTSARAFDVNEYYNVMPFISDTNQIRQQLDPLPVEGGLTHGDVMESFGYAAAMMHMNGSQKSKYKRNEKKHLEAAMKKAGLKKDSAEWTKQIDRFETLYVRAEADLAKGKRELYAKMEELGLDKNVPENEIRARSELYQERIESYYDQLKKLDIVWEGNDNAAKHELRAKIEREMAYFLREGIETYSGSATLDIIVSQMQIAGLKIDKALLNNTFDLMGELSHLRREDIDFMVRDQCLMMVEHINGYYHGHELPYNSGKALAKYAQRGLLALKIRGDINLKAAIDKNDLNNPALKLHRMTEQLMAQKPNPDGFNEVLSSFTTEGTPDAGLKELMSAIEKVIPGMEGMSDVDNFQHLADLKIWDSKNPYKTKGFFQYVRLTRHREEAATAQRITDLAGGAAYKYYLQSQREEAERALAEIAARLELYKEVNSNYEAKDWPEVLRLKKAINGCRIVLSKTPLTSPKLTDGVAKPKLKMEARLRELLLPKELQSAPSRYSPYARLWLQTQHLQVLLEENSAALIDAEKQIAHEAKYKGMNLSGVWQFDRGSYRGRVKIEQIGYLVKMWFTVDSMQGKPPHFYAEAKFIRGRLRGAWEELHTEDLKINAPAKAWNERGLFFAKVDEAGKLISIDKRSTELASLKAGDWRWAGINLTPAPEGTRAPTNLKILTVKTSSIGQKQAPTIDDREPRSRQGGLYVVQYKADGSAAHNNYGLYTVGTYKTHQEDKVAQVRTNSNHNMLPGIYELIIKNGDKAERLPVTIVAGQVTKMTLPAMGQLRFKQVDHRGREISMDMMQLRVFKDGKAIGWVGYSPMQLKPGSYEVVIYYDNAPIGSGGSYRRTVEIAEKSETVIQARFGSYQIQIQDADGKPLAQDAYVTATFINPDRSSGASRSDEIKAPIALLPGSYRMECRLASNNTFEKEISIIPAELTKETVQLGRLKLYNHSKPMRANDGVRVLITAKGGKPSYIMVTDPTQIDLFPGTYEVMLIDTSGKSTTQQIKIYAGRSAALTFEL